MDFDKEINKYLGEDFTNWMSKKLYRNKKKEVKTKKPEVQDVVVANIKKRNQMLAKATSEGNTAAYDRSNKLAQIRTRLAAMKKKTGTGPYGTAPAGWGKQKPIAGPKPIKEYTIEDWIVESYTNILWRDLLKVALKEVLIIEDGTPHWILEDDEETKMYVLFRTEELIEDIQTIEESGYQEFFKGMLAKRGVKSPMELSPEDRKAFFDQVKKQWAVKK
jgi:hypothetical protein